MKRPWLSVAAFCAVFFGIIIFCVIFGSYSSQYRAQNRTEAAKEQLALDCEKRLELLPELVSMARKTGALEFIDPVNLDKVNFDQVTETAKMAESILTRIHSKGPLEKELILDFEQSQVQVSRKIATLIKGIKDHETLKKSADFIALEKKFMEFEFAVFADTHQYNREADYFNTRKEIFPGFLVAKLFDLEEIFFPEITADLFTPQKIRT
ncbi:MAG: LemA family protein [Proteobacteria bacterium]|nr:hypothetical protein [Desulfobacula sp.]MBU3952024.1 LemA family protein [Pseudomonadota bacterium]MBU4130677.1 LemA family protein [Pseudomonadota bacterium]